MLTASAATTLPLTPLPSAPDDALALCRTRTKKAPAGAAAGGTAKTAAPAGGGATAAPAGTGATVAKPTPGAKARTATPRARTLAGGYARAASTATSSRAAGAAPRTAPGASSAAKAAKQTGPLAFLDDPKLSMEEKLLKLLAYLNDKWNKELDQKMKEFKTGSKEASSSGASSSSGLGGLVKKAVSFASSAMPALGFTLEALKNPAVRSVARSIAGPALAAAATAAGQPQLAPVALKLGPDLVDFAASAAPSGGGSSGSGGGGTSSGAAKESADGIGSDKDAQLKLMEMQRIIDQQKEMFSLVSNVLRTTHETRMAVIQNVR